MTELAAFLIVAISMSAGLVIGRYVLPRKEPQPTTTVTIGPFGRDEKPIDDQSDAFKYLYGAIMQQYEEAPAPIELVKEEYRAELPQKPTKRLRVIKGRRIQDRLACAEVFKL